MRLCQPRAVASLRATRSSESDLANSFAKNLMVLEMLIKLLVCGQGRLDALHAIQEFQVFVFNPDFGRHSLREIKRHVTFARCRAVRTTPFTAAFTDAALAAG